MSETRPQDRLALLSLAAVVLAVIVARNAAGWLRSLAALPTRCSPYSRATRSRRPRRRSSCSRSAPVGHC
jgi:hypothetical protein